MSSGFEITKKMPRYLKRLSVEYTKNGNAPLAQVIEGSKFEVREEVEYDNWNGGTYGHDVLFYVPDKLMGLIPLDTQQDIQNKIREDLNKVASAADSEYVSGVHFEYLDESDPAISSVSNVNSGSVTNTAKSRLWRPNSIKMFISHRDTSKVLAHELAKALSGYGVSSFVAHDSIEPDEDWQKEIEKALQSMDVLLAFITDDLFDSAWTNQEIGYALAGDIPVISIKLGQVDPVGFIRNRQAIKGHPDRMQDNATKIWSTLEKRLAGTTILRSSIITRFANSRSFAAASNAFDVIKRLGSFTEDEIEKLVGAFNSNGQISGCYALTTSGQFLNLMNQHATKKYVQRDGQIFVQKRRMEPDDDLPF